LQGKGQGFRVDFQGGILLIPAVFANLSTAAGAQQLIDNRVSGHATKRRLQLAVDIAVYIKIAGRMHGLNCTTVA